MKETHPDRDAKEQASQIQKVSAQIEASRRAQQTVASNP
jgi:hypothetical protein